MSFYATYIRPIVMWLGVLLNPGLIRRQAERQSYLDASAEKFKELQQAHNDFMHNLELFRQARLANETLDEQNKHRLAANSAHHRFHKISNELDAMRPSYLRRKQGLTS